MATQATMLAQAQSTRACFRQILEAYTSAKKIVAAHEAYDLSQAAADPAPAYVGLDGDGNIGGIDMTPADYINAITMAQGLIVLVVGGAVIPDVSRTNVLMRATGAKQ